MNKLVLLLPWLVISSCVNPSYQGEQPHEISMAPTRAHLSFSVEGQACEGACLVQRKVVQKIVLQVPANTIRVEVKSCHRREVFKNPAKPFAYTYIPVLYVENWDSCILQLDALTDRGNIYSAIVDFSSNETMPARLYCNAKTIDSGVLNASFCQGQAGLFQRITFDRVVETYSPSNCNKPESKDNRNFDLELSEGFCVYLFQDNQRKTHRLTTYGFRELEKEDR